MKKINGLCIVVIAFAFLSQRTFATTKGLSQIVTPDLQPEGQLSLSFQTQARQIANPFEFQAELGLTKNFEVAIFQGLSPNEQLFGSELGLIQHEPYLLTAGVINWSTLGGGPQPFVEAGYYTEHDKFILGTIRANNRIETILGWAHDFNQTWRFQVDFQSGTGNSSTIGFTCNLTHNFQFNPAIYVTNDSPHRLLGYIVFTYTFPLSHRDRVP